MVLSVNVFSVGVEEIGRLKFQDVLPNFDPNKLTYGSLVSICTGKAALTFIRVMDAGSGFFPMGNEKFYLNKISLGSALDCDKRQSVIVDDFEYIKLGETVNTKELGDDGYRLIDYSDAYMKYYKIVKEQGVDYGVDRKGQEKRVDILIELNDGVIFAIHYEEGYYD